MLRLRPVLRGPPGVQGRRLVARRRRGKRGLRSALHSVGSREGSPRRWMGPPRAAAPLPTRADPLTTRADSIKTRN